MKNKIILFLLVFGSMFTYLYFASPIVNTVGTSANAWQKLALQTAKSTAVSEKKTPVPVNKSKSASNVKSSPNNVTPIPTPKDTAEDKKGKDLLPEVSSNTILPEMTPVDVHVADVATAVATTSIENKVSETPAGKITPPGPDEMVLYKPHEWKMECYSLLADGKILITSFEKKDWWTWNIQGWYIAEDNVVPSENRCLLAGGGTDWEYVLRVAKTENSQFVMSGGNHGKECLRNFRLYNGVTGTPIDIENGKWTRIKSLQIIEKTALTFDDGRYDGYAEVTRTYVVSPANITLKTDFLFTQDVYMGVSYVCMFPVEKKTGQYFWFQDQGHVFKTPANGHTNTANGYDSYLGLENTRYVRAWGDDDKRYVFGVWIRDNEMVDDFKNKLKVFVWDLNKGGNKLYFSKYDNDHKKISKGTAWHNMQGWELGLQK